MFFLETSSSSSFTVRQSCAIESAAIQTRRNIIVVINTPFLPLCQESMKGYIWIFSLFYLIQFFSKFRILLQRNILFVKLNTSFLARFCLKLFTWSISFHNVRLTPLSAMYEDGRMSSSCCKTFHYSDTLRLALLYRSHANFLQ